MRAVEPAEAPRVLTQHLAQVRQPALTSLKGDSGALEVVNQLLLALIQKVHRGAVEPSPTGSPDSQEPRRKPLGRLAAQWDAPARGAGARPPLCRKKSHLPQANRNFLLLAGTKNPSTMLGRGFRPGP